MAKKANYGRNRYMEEKGIVASDCLPPEPRCPLTRHHRLGGGQRASRRWCHAAVVPHGGGASRRWCLAAVVPGGAGAWRRWCLAALVPGGAGAWRVAAVVPRGGGASWRWCLAAVVPHGAGASRRWCLAAVVPSGGGASWRQAVGRGLRLETIAGINPFLLVVAVHVFQGVKVKVPFPPIPSQPWLR
ncbi:unnamed protein product [Boreogadus saida]